MVGREGPIFFRRFIIDGLYLFTVGSVQCFVASLCCRIYLLTLLFADADCFDGE